MRKKRGGVIRRLKKHATRATARRDQTVCETFGLDQYKIGTRLLFAGNITRQPYMRGRNYRIYGQLTHTDKILHDTFCIGVQPALSEEALSFVVEKLETFFNF